MHPYGYLIVQLFLYDYQGFFLLIFPADYWQPVHKNIAGWGFADKQ